MGVSGCGKSTIGKALAQELGCHFYDGDDFHPTENVAKMARGLPLNDDDRYPWLMRLHDLLMDHVARGKTAVLACSALKKTHRDLLRVKDETCFVFLNGSFELIWQRMSARQNHFMKAEMLQSQFDTLQIPDSDDVIMVDISQPVEVILKKNKTADFMIVSGANLASWHDLAHFFIAAAPNKPVI